MKAYLKNYRQSPRKVRLVANLIKGKTVTRAQTILKTVPKRATGQLDKLLASAVANARTQENTAPDQLVIESIRVDQGLVMRRSLPRAHGRATPIRKKTSHVMLTLGVKREKTNTSPKGEKASVTPRTKAKKQ